MTRCVAQRIWAKTVIDPETGCWQWTGGTTDRGYGRIQVGGRGSFLYPHRAMYELLVGPIPEGFDIDHLCRNHSCCNPDHLEPVTRRENLMRGETLTRAHHEDRDCGFDGCKNCARFRRTHEATTR